MVIEQLLEKKRTQMAEIAARRQWPLVDKYRAFARYRHKLIAGHWTDKQHNEHVAWAETQFGPAEQLFVYKVGEKHNFAVTEWHVPDIDRFWNGRWFARFNVFRFAHEQDAALFKLFRM